MKPTRRPTISLVTDRDVLMNALSPHKSPVFGSSSSLRPLVGGDGGLVCKSVGKVYLMSDHFDSKQSRESSHLLLICYPSLSLITFAFR